MALTLVQVNTWNTKRPEKYKRGSGHDHYVSDGDYYLLNTNRMSDIKVTSTGGTIFKFNQAPDDHRASWDTIETNSSVAAIEEDHNITPDSKFAVLSIYPTLDITRVDTDTPVDTEIAWENIALAWQTPRDAEWGVCHLVYYDKSWKRKTVIVEAGALLVIYGTQVDLD
jgi:hypothetical protein